MSDAIASRNQLLLGSKLLLGANGVLWIVFGVVWLEPTSGGSWAAPYQAALLSALMFANATILITLAFRLRAPSGWLPWMAFIWVGVNLLLSFTDEVGPADLAVGALNAVTLFLLAAFRRARGRTSP